MVSPPSDFEQEKRPKTPDDRARAAAGSRRYRRANKDEINEHWRGKYRTDPEFRERVKERARQISNDAYDVLFARQGGVCAICKKKYHRRLHADHCHVTGKLRGLLCSKCNTGLGLYNDDADRLLAAVAYLVASRCDLGAADPAVIAAGMAEQLSRRLQVHLRAAFGMAPPGGCDREPVAETCRFRCAFPHRLFEKMRATLRWVIRKQASRLTPQMRHPCSLAHRSGRRERGEPTA